jgi:hypothetical protein
MEWNVIVLSMSTHRKIEWSLFILGLIGTGLSLWLNAPVIQVILFGVSGLFAGFHTLKIYDGHKSNHIVVATSLALIAYVGYMAVMNLSDLSGRKDLLSGLITAIFLASLSLRLRRDFHPK